MRGAGGERGHRPRRGDGKAIEAWVVRRDIPYEASVPSLILAKTAEVVAQALLLLTGILVAWTTVPWAGPC